VADLWRGVVAAAERLRRRRSAMPAGGAVRAARADAARVARRREVTALRRGPLSYAPDLDGRADPGEIVWTWVGYEDDPRRGKDRPVLVVGRHSRTLYGLMLSSRSDRDGQRHWFPLGSGAWDGGRRPSWVRLDRVLTMREDGIRREGAVLDRTRFDLVCRLLRTHYGWR
jgi:hypothetical protein